MMIIMPPQSYFYMMIGSKIAEIYILKILLNIFRNENEQNQKVLIKKINNDDSYLLLLTLRCLMSILPPRSLNLFFQT